MSGDTMPPDAWALANEPKGMVAPSGLSAGPRNRLRLALGKVLNDRLLAVAAAAKARQ